ncbi:MAG: topoisomerase DNA-binding C4 zinc finger domain-containing protein [candidate division Zixibacteria bacterium]|nr:topoisomerase DNA-binding C4 zinc finger domain-containing protein [candidate division Zixibacteria bacterium]
MQLKRGARGLFLGCSAWPKCDFTRESESILK